MPIFLVFAACAFVGGFALRVVDPIVLSVAGHFAVSPSAAALLTTAYALPYALAQPLLGPLGDRFGKMRCIRLCVLAVALALAAGSFAPSFAWLLASRIAAGVFAGGLIPLVIASLGDTYDMSERQVMIGRMLFAIISGQMLGSVVAGFANDAFGWRSALLIAMGVGIVATAVAWLGGSAPDGPARTESGSIAALYGRVLANPKSLWLIGGVAVEGAFFYGLFPYMGELLLATAGASPASIAAEAGMVLGAFGVGGLLYALGVRALLRRVGVRRLGLAGSAAAAAAYVALAFAPSWSLAALAMLVSGFSFYMLHNSMQTEATELAPSARGSAVALFAFGFFIGQGLGPLIFGGLLHGLGPRPALVAVAAVIVVLGRVMVAQVIDRRACA